MKKSLPKLYATLLLLFGILTFASAQRAITGTVTDAETGEGLIGATIRVTGTNTGAITDIDGNFSLTLPTGSNEITVSFTGYTAQTIAVGASNVLTIALAAGKVLDEFVVIGYGTTTIRDATGAVASLKTKDFNQGVQVSPEQMIQGRTPGVQVTSSNGEPGSANNIRIRGTTSIRSGNGPLFVVDGVPLNGDNISAGGDVQDFGSTTAKNPLNFINPSDIESIDVLKDASSAAIYGTRGANGVVFITTKKGKGGAPQVSYSGSIGMSKVAGSYDLLDAASYPDAARAAGNSNPDFGSVVTPYDDIFRTGVVHNHDFSIGGGSETGNYRFSFGMLDQDGIVKNTGLKKYTGTAKFNQYALKDVVKLEGTIIASFLKDQSAAITDNTGAEGDLFSSAIRWNPTRAYKDSLGNYIQPSDNQRNPQAFLDYYSDGTETSRVLANAGVTVNLMEGLKYKLNLGSDRSESVRGMAFSQLFNANITKGRGFASIENIRTTNSIIEHTLNLDRDLSKSIGLSAVVGYSYQNFTRKGNKQVGRDFSGNDQDLYIKYLPFASTFSVQDQRAFYEPNVELQSFFGRAAFDINNRFLITGTLRADGSSKFQKDNRYGYFPSFAAAWKLSEEAFIPEVFNQLKLRVGYGITGNQEFGAGLTQDQVFPEFTGADPSQRIVGNPNLKWESTTQLGVGLDFAFMDERLGGSIDWYSKNTNDLLFRLPTIAPAPPGFFWTNLDGIEVQNSGLELGIYANLVHTRDFNFDLNFNTSFQKNAIVNVSNSFPAGIVTGGITGQGLSGESGQLLYDDQELYAFYMPVFEGFDDSGAAIYKDVNGDGVVNIANGAPGTVDRDFVGTPNPDVLLGLQGALQYKNLDFSLYFNGAFGHQVYDNTSLAFFSRGALRGGNNVTTEIANSTENPNNSLTVSSRFLYDADYLRLSNATLGYNFKLANGKWIKGLRFYLTGQNLFLITKYKGLDPEVNINKAVDGVPSFGIDYKAYPRSRTIIFGVNANF